MSQKTVDNKTSNLKSKIKNYENIGKYRVVTVYKDSTEDYLPGILLMETDPKTMKDKPECTVYMIAPLAVNKLPEFIVEGVIGTLFHRVIEVPFGNPEDNLVQIMSLYIFGLKINDKPVFVNLPWFYSTLTEEAS